jgi:hypothetical protein
MTDITIEHPGLSTLSARLESFTGIVHNHQQTSETYVSGHGGQINPQVYANQGGVSITSHVERRTSFWLVDEHGEELAMQLAGTFNVRDGHEVTAVWADYGGGKTRYVYLLNHTAGYDWVLQQDNAAVLRRLVRLVPSGAPGVKAVLVWVAYALAVLYLLQFGQGGAIFGGIVLFLVAMGLTSRIKTTTVRALCARLVDKARSLAETGTVSA